MSVVFPVNADPRFRLSTAVGGETVFSVPFPFQDNNDIAVVRYGVEGVGTRLTEGPDYSLTGSGSASGGSVLLAAPMATGERLLRAGAAIIDRVQSVVRSGRFASRAIDDDIDRFIIIAQELARDRERSLKLPMGYSAIDLPPPSAGKFFAWDTGGNITFVDVLQAGELIASDFGQSWLMQATAETAGSALGLGTLARKSAIGAIDISDSEVPAIRSKLQITSTQRAGLDGVFVTPPAFTHRAAPFVYDRSPGQARLISELRNRFLVRGWDCRSLADLPPGVKGYCVSDSGSDSNDGLTWATALATIPAALAKSDRDVILCQGDFTHYDLTRAMGIYTGSRNVAIIAVGRPGIMSPMRKTIWSAGSLPGTFQSEPLGGTPVGATNGLKRDEFGDYGRFRIVATEAEVAASSGEDVMCSVPTGTTPKVVVKRADGLTPSDANTWVMRGFTNRFQGNNCAMYLRNWIFPEGFSARASTVSSIIAVEDCLFCGERDADGYQIKDVGLSIAINCKAIGNFNDGFNYHALNGLTPHAIEIDCTGIRNLASGTGNGSTAHEDVSILRVRTSCYDNNGPGIADVNSARAYNIDFTSNNNGQTSPNTNAAGLLVQDDVVAWIHGGAADGNSAPNQIVAKGNSTLYYRDCNPIPVALENATVLPF